jgi:hypothetical protein
MQHVSVKGNRNQTGRYQHSTGRDQNTCQRKRHSGITIEIRDIRAVRAAAALNLKMSVSMNFGEAAEIRSYPRLSSSRPVCRSTPIKIVDKILAAIETEN